MGGGPMSGHLLCAGGPEECTEMVTGKKHRRTNPQNPPSRDARRETSAADAATIAWTVTVTTLVICELMGLAAVIYMRMAPQAEGARSLAGVAQFGALVLAVLSLILMVIVYRVRRVPPPVGYVAFAGVVAVLPFVTAAWNVLR